MEFLRIRPIMFKIPSQIYSLFHIVHSFLFAKIGKNRSIAWYGILFLVLFLITVLWRPPFLTSLDQKLYDVMHGSHATFDRPLPLLVDIDEKSLAVLGQWPWPRYRVARLFKKLSEAKPASVGLDIIFAEPDRTSLNEIRQDLFKATGVALNLAAIPDKLRDNDVILADALAAGPYVLGYRFLPTGAKDFPPGLRPVNIAIFRGDSSPDSTFALPEGSKVIAPLPIFVDAVKHSGFVDIQPDSDGVIRKTPLLIRFQGQIYPSLALTTVMQALGTENIVLNVSNLGIESLRIRDTIIPLDAAGNMLIKYRGPRFSFDYVSAVDILTGQVDKKVIAGRVIFVGSSAAGLNDLHPTPLDPIYPGLEIQATIADNILHTTFYQRPAWAKIAEFFLTLIVGVFVSILLAYFRPWPSLLFTVATGVFLWFGSRALLQVQGLFISPFYPIIAIGGIFPFLSLLKFRLAEKLAHQQEREREKIDTELQVAREIQLGILPKQFPPFPERNELAIFANLIPAREVGGDFYDFFFTDHKHLCFTIGDVSDKGVPAALFMAIARTLIKNSAQHLLSPAEIMNKVNQVLSTDNPRVMFVTLIVGIINIETGEVRYANGGHNPPIITKGRQQSAEYKDDLSGPLVGMMPDFQFKEIQLLLEPGDAIFLYTDGVTEATDENGVFFSSERLLKEFQNIGHEPVEDVVAKILQGVRGHAGSAPQSDDIAMMMIRYR